MKRSIIWSLYKKEMLDILRDKKTVIIMILVPIILYPLLFLGATYAVSAIMQSQQDFTYKIAFYQVEQQEAIASIMNDKTDDLDYHFEVIECDDWQQALTNKKIDVCITEEKKEKQTIYHIQYLSSVSDSATAANMMKDIFTEYREQLRKKTVENQGLDTVTVLYPIQADLADRASNEEAFGSIIGSLLPFLMIVSILMGAIYPAIDATAGEKERGTLETLLTLPVSNYELIISKFLAVSTLASISAFLNFISMGMVGTLLYQSVQFSGNVSSNIDFVTFIPALLVMLACVLVFAMLLSALCLCICIFAKSFKEAQNYSTPLLLVVMLVGYIGFIPGIALDSFYAVVPVANIVLLIKDIFTFQYSFGNLFLVLFSNIIYSFLAIFLLSKMYRSESILFGEGKNVKIFERRVNMKKGQMPGVGDAFLLLAISVLVMFYIGTYAQMKLGFGGVAVQQGLFLLLTVGFAWYMKADYKKLFSLKVPKLSAVFGSLFLWIGSYLGIILLSIPLSSIFQESASEMKALNDWFSNQPFWAILLVVGILPAICEEALFRGFLFGTLKEKWKPWIAIVVSGVIFGIYHMSVIKMVTITFLGIALAYSVYCSQSIITSVFMHCLNNTFAVILSAYPKRLEKIFPVLFEENPSSMTLIFMVCVAVICVIAGVGILKWSALEKQKRQGI